MRRNTVTTSTEGRIAAVFLVGIVLTGNKRIMIGVSVDLTQMRIRINHGKGDQDRYVLFLPYFHGTSAQYVSIQKDQGATYLFESNRISKITTRWIWEIIKKYARSAGITKRIHPHLFRHQILAYLTSKGIVDAKIQLISGHKNRESLSIYQDLSLADIEKE